MSQITEERIREIIEEEKVRQNREAGKAVGNLICETPVVREIAGAVVSVLSIFKL